MIEVLRLALKALNAGEHAHLIMNTDGIKDKVRQAIAELESQEPVAWKLMPRDATDAMLKAMDECSTEGYDERLYAGHAASVYMAAWDASDTHPPQRTEQNFCSRCGKRTNDIHTCTPPQEKNNG
jgi:hypothetical protein